MLTPEQVEAVRVLSAAGIIRYEKVVVFNNDFSDEELTWWSGVTAETDGLETRYVAGRGHARFDVTTSAEAMMERRAKLQPTINPAFHDEIVGAAHASRCQVRLEDS